MADIMCDKQQRLYVEYTDLSYISEYTPEVADKRINYHNKKKKLFKMEAFSNHHKRLTKDH